MGNPMTKVSPELALAAINDVRARRGWPPLSSLGGKDPRAVAKLKFSEMCEIYAFCLCKVPKNLIAIVFDVSAATVYRVQACNTKKYPRVFAEFYSYNTNKEFCRVHITEKNEVAIRELYPQFTRPEN